jgi:ABC-type glycerol-3-phosphate transport system substrate-binding protein
MKTLAKLITLVVAVTMLVACGTPATPTPANTAVPPTPVPPTATPVPPTAAPEPVTITYADWNAGTPDSNSLVRQMAAAYMETHPWVTIEFVDMSGEGNWREHLTAYAAQGKLPDVMMLDDGPSCIMNGWCADLTSLVQNDADWANVAPSIKSVMTYNGKVRYLPVAYFLEGYWVNKDLFEAANLDAPEYGISPDDFFAAVQSLQNLPKGILGMDEQEFIVGWYPHSQDTAMGWFSYDGAKMNYNSTVFKDALAKGLEMKPYTWQGLSDADKTNFKSAGPWELFLKQETGVRWDGSWTMGDIIKNATFNWDFMGYPGGFQSLGVDIFGISASTTHLEAAYDFAKWMTFSSAGYAKQFELAKAAGSAPKMPLSMDAASLALYKTYIDKPGINAALDNLNGSILEALAKFVPGYIQARWEGKPGIDIGTDKDVNMWYTFNAAMGGAIKYEDFSAQLETFANQKLTDAAAAMP